MTKPNQAPSGNGAMRILCHAESLFRAVPEQRRWANTSP
jgi:hypothetical protein